MGSGDNGADWVNPTPQNPKIVYKIGIYGWRKRCLYLFILLLLVVTIINLSLTIWIIQVMDFSIDGMGKLRVVDDGIRVEGMSEFLKTLHASRLASRKNKPLHIESAKNITLNARDSNKKVRNRLILGNNKIEAYANLFEIYSTDGDKLFSANDREIFVGADQLKVSGELGATFSRSVQSPLVKPDGNQTLRLAAPSSAIQVKAPEGISLEASNGSITLQSLADIKIISRSESIHLDAKNITFKNLFISQPSFDGLPYPEVYQLCVCGQNGLLFLSPSRGNCQATSSICN